MKPVFPETDILSSNIIESEADISPVVNVHTAVTPSTRINIDFKPSDSSPSKMM